MNSEQRAEMMAMAADHVSACQSFTTAAEYYEAHGDDGSTVGSLLDGAKREQAKADEAARLALLAALQAEQV
jgi:hypothetical protein